MTLGVRTVGGQKASGPHLEDGGRSRSRDGVVLLIQKRRGSTWVPKYAYFLSPDNKTASRPLPAPKGLPVLRLKLGLHTVFCNRTTAPTYYLTPTPTPFWCFLCIIVLTVLELAS